MLRCRNTAVFILQRSYAPDLFDIAMMRMIKAQIKSSLELEQFSRLKEKANALLLSKQQDDVDFANVPDEFKGTWFLIEHNLKVSEITSKYSTTLPRNNGCYMLL